MAELFRLHDGRVVEIRPISGDDQLELQAFHRRLSMESQRLRFFAPLAELSDAMADRLTHLDGVERYALVANFPGEKAIRGVGRYERTTGDSAEVAFVVEDSVQSQGLGSELLRRVAGEALANGLHALTALVLPENHHMLDVFRHSGLPCDVRAEGGLFTVRLVLGGAGDGTGPGVRKAS